jgi:hypothetical protein
MDVFHTWPATQPATQPYSNHPLNPTQNQIRLLCLLPHHDKQTPIIGKLSVVSLLDKPVYDALSYVWGSPLSWGGLELDGGHIFIGQNLETALRYLRLSDKPRTLWVDAVCINQSDSAEKSHQVRLMRDVYSQAATVRAWIDRSIDASAEVFNHLAMMPEGPRNNTNINWLPMTAIFRDPYWTRLWIQQEVIMAKELVMHFRSNKLDSGPLLTFTQLMWNAFRTRKASQLDLIALEEHLTMELNGHVYSGWKFLGRNYERCRTMRLSESGPLLTVPVRDTPIPYHGTLMSLYMDSGHLSVTDPRDRVYGMLGIATDCSLENVLVDYSLSAFEVYGEVFKHFIRVYDNLSFLCCAAITPLCREVNCTWLPHPRARGSSFDLLVHTRGAGSVISVVTSYIRPLGDSLTLTARGVLVDCVKSTGLHRVLHLAAIDDWYADLRSLCLETNSEALMNEAWDSIVLTKYIQAIQALEHKEKPRSLTVNDLYSRYCQKVLDHGHGALRLSLMSIVGEMAENLDLSPEDEKMFNLFLLSFADAQFVTTRSGRLGIATSGYLESGTEIWAVFGCPILLALNRGPAGCYTLSGQIWLDGLMDGEACKEISLSGESTPDYTGPLVTDLILC